MTGGMLNSKPIPRRRSPFALAALIAIVGGVVGVPAAFFAGYQAIALGIGIVAVIVTYVAVSRGWAWVGSRAAPLAKNETVFLESPARSDSANQGTVTVTNRRVFFEPAASAILRGRGPAATGWDLPKSAITAVRRESQDASGNTRGGTQHLVIVSKAESHWLQPRDFDALASAVTKATGLSLTS